MLNPAGRRACLTVADQGVSSLSNFTTGLIIARLSGPAEFGRYMLVFTIWVIVVGIHRAVITDPIIVSARDTDAGRSVMAKGLGAELVLGVVVSAVVAVGGLAALLVAGSDTGRLMVAVAPWFVSLLVQDYWRSMAFQQRRPGFALANDTLFAIVQFATVGAFWALNRTSATWIIAAWGIGATAGGIVGLRLCPGIKAIGHSRRFMADLWPTSRWMLADFVTGFFSQQAYLVFVYVLLSQVDYGGLRAATLLMGPSVVIFHAGANVGLPEAARRLVASDPLSLRRFASRLTAITLAAIVAYGALVTIFGRLLLRALFGPEFQRFDLLVTLAALQSVFFVSVFGQATALKAAGKMRSLWRTRVAASVASLTTTVVLVGRLDAAGAAWGGVATGLYYALGVSFVYRRALAHDIGPPTEHAPPPGDLTIAPQTG